MTPKEIDSCVRKALKSDPRSDYRIAIDSGIPQTIVSRFRRGEGATWGTMCKLISVLGLKVGKED